MRKIYTFFTILITLSLPAQTIYDFQNDQSMGGWVSGGGGITDANLSITSEGLEISWDGPGETSWTNGRKPKIKHDNANVDADNLKIFAISLHNTSGTVTRLRVLHFKGLNGSDPSNPAGSDTRYTSFDIPSSTDPPVPPVEDEPAPPPLALASAEPELLELTFTQESPPAVAV